MKMLLIHGRHKPDEDLEDWGFNGPTLTGVKYVHWTYGNMTVGFTSREHAEEAQKNTGWEPFDDLVLEVREHQDMLKAKDTKGKDAYYGDYEIQEDGETC